jgi:C-terminal processing protease CtpA/Prc
MLVDVIENALNLFCAKYIYPEKAAAAAQAIRARRDAGEYQDLDEKQLAERLTAELYEVCADKHLTVRLRPPDLEAALTEAEVEAAQLEWERQHNYGVAKVERLEGNVGYLDIRFVTDPRDGGPAITAAMQLVAHTDALIIDLRRNRGGEPDGVAFWHSYLFPDSKTHLNDIYDGNTGETRQYWTFPFVPGVRYPDNPVYALIGGGTLSAGEEFCYNLKALGRATLIGQTTWGGAHPTEAFPLTGTLMITVPYARAINPVTATNWEGTGVEPDIKVPSEDAFTVAYEKALKHCLTTATSPWAVTEIREALEKQPGPADPAR